MGTELRIVAAEARAVRSSGKRGQHRVGWYACPRLTLFATEWSAARRKPIRAAVVPIRSPLLKTSRPVGFRRATAENFRPRKFSKRARLWGSKESQPWAGVAPNPKRPRLPEARTARASATATQEVRPRLLGIEECPHSFRGPARHAQRCCTGLL